MSSSSVSTAVREITVAHSPDSDDAFMFYALATNKVRVPGLKFSHTLTDIETLNRKAMEGVYELSAISYHAYPYVMDKYVLMASGSSVGDGYGPMVVALHPMEPEEIKGKKIGGAHFQYLSMGMSSDYQVAVEEGATHLRVGTALFE